MALKDLSEATARAMSQDAGTAAASPASQSVTRITGERKARPSPTPIA